MSSYASPSQSLAIRPAAEQVVPTVNLGALIRRIEEAVTEETQSIRTDIRFDIKASNARKSRYLYELTRALKGTREGSVPAEHRDGLVRLRERLADNESAIRAHLSAVNEVAMLMQNVIQHAENDGTYSAGEFRVHPVIKFIVAAIWLCVVTIGAVFYSFQNAAAKLDAPAAPPLLGGLDYIKTEIVSVPILTDGHINGYFLTRLVYMVEPDKIARLSVPADSLIIDQVYSYIYGNPQLDFVNHETLDLDAFRAGVRDQINKKVGEDVVHEVLIEQVDFLSKEEIRDNTIRRKMQAGATAREMAKGFKDPPAKSH